MSEELVRFWPALSPGAPVFQMLSDATVVCVSGG
jgi:hypothetical protein